MTRGKVVKPKLEKYIFISFCDEALALISFLKYQWYFVAAVVAFFTIAVWTHNPFPPAKVRIASGQENSTLEVIAKRYKAFFAQSGIDVELITTHGAIENLDALKSGQADIAISQGGISLEGATGIVSLGSIGYQPLWFFHFGEPLTDANVFEALRGKKISIGIAGSGTRLVADAILDIVPPDVRSTYDLVGLAADESIDALRKRSIDGMLFLAGFESGNTQLLLGLHGIQTYNFKMAEGLTRRLPYMEVVKVPLGAFGVAPVAPPVDTHMVATTTTILVHEKLHPAVQHLLLQASAELHRREETFFTRPGGFPAFVDKATPRSEVAVRFYADGPLVLERYLPHWLASFLSLSWFWFVGFFAIIIPVISLAPSYRKFMFNIILSDYYGRLFTLYRAAVEVRTKEEFAEILSQFHVLNHEIISIWVPKGCLENQGIMLQFLGNMTKTLEMLECSLAPSHTKVTSS